MFDKWIYVWEKYTINLTWCDRKLMLQCTQFMFCWYTSLLCSYNWVYFLTLLLGLYRGWRIQRRVMSALRTLQST